MRQHEIITVQETKGSDLSKALRFMILKAVALYVPLFSTPNAYARTSQQLKFRHVVAAVAIFCTKFYRPADTFWFDMKKS